ncbi:DUF397 domain-containing protein [Nocardia sp. bgisy118]|uniref:DUF397 domain-containing protein n=1 Tax=Nocardia sp. bgisy118 TaxID=3413786 RepID=UPI003F4A1A8D
MGLHRGRTPPRWTGGLRDSKDPVGGLLACSRSEWAAFARAIAGGGFQQPIS